MTIDSSKLNLFDFGYDKDDRKLLIWTGLTRYNGTHFEDENGHFLASKSLAIDSGWDENYFDFPDIFIATLANR